MTDQSDQEAVASPDSDEGSIAGYISGTLLAVAGCILFFYYAFAFSITVETVDGNIVNMGLAAQQIVAVVGGAALFISGLILIVANVLADKIGKQARPSE